MRQRLADRVSTRTALVAAVVIAVILGVLGLVPVRSQTLSLEAPRAIEPVPIDDPWASTWDTVPALRVPLSAQNVTPPFGGGSISAVTVRAQHDADAVYFLLEWSDANPSGVLLRLSLDGSPITGWDPRTGFQFCRINDPMAVKRAIESVSNPVD